MKTLVPTGLALAFGPLLAIAAQAPAADLPDARALVDAWLERSGHVEACRKTRSVRTTGRVEVVGAGLAGTIETLAAKPDRQVSRIELDGVGTIASGFDGEVAWSIHPATGARVLDGVERFQLVFDALYEAPMKPAARYERFETVAREAFDGRDCWRIELVARAPEGLDPDTTRAARTTAEFYEVDGGAFAGSIGTKVTPMGALAVTTYARRYREFGDRLIATELVQVLPMQETRVTVDEIEYDRVERSAFALPPAVRERLARE